jgi:hypothetical protein
MRFLLLSLCLPFLAASQSASVSNLTLGYQEFPTVIQGHATDSRGNQYFTGYFRGELNVNNAALRQGDGLEDVFWIKTNSSGQILQQKTFGSDNSEVSYTDALAIDGGDRMVFGMRVFAPVNLGSVTVQPYPTPTGSFFATSIVAIDTSGSVLWAKRMNLQNFRIIHTGGVFHVIGTVIPISPATRVENDIVLDSIGNSGIVHLMFNRDGNFLGAKKIIPRKLGQTLNLASVQGYSDGRLLYMFRMIADSSFVLGNTPVPLPASYLNYHVMIRVDTSYTQFRIKNFTPVGNGIGPGAGTSIPVAVGAADSVYTVFNTESATPAINVDGFSHPAQTNTLYVLDTTLTVRRQAFLSSSVAGYYPQHTGKRKVFFKNLLVQNNEIMLIGQYTGINESPFNAIVRRDTIVAILPGVTATVDQNGNSRGFVARCNLDGSNGQLNWFGDHREYENFTMTMSFFHPAGNNHFCFYILTDNKWNPFLFNRNLALLSGATQRTADQPEVPQMVQYLPDGSRIVIGYARGRTALDSANSAFLNNQLRRDIFVARIGNNNQVLWYKRWHCTLPQSDIRNLEVNNGKAYFLINYSGSVNDSNFLRINNTTYSFRLNNNILGGGVSLMCDVDAAGNISVYNLGNATLQNFHLRQFNFFSNNDLLVASAPDNLNLPGFSAGSGMYLLRFNTGTRTLASARRITGPSLPTVHSLQIDQNNQIYFSASAGNSTSVTHTLQSETGQLDQLVVGGSSPGIAHTLFKLNWDRFHWQKRFSNHALSTFTVTGRYYGDLQLVNGRPVFTIPFTTVALNWDGQVVTTAQQGIGTTFISLDTNGSFVKSKILPSLFHSYSRRGANKQLYVSGSAAVPLQVDTISIANAGFSDGVGLVLDSALKAKRSFRVGSPYGEGLTDMDIYRDSLIALAFTAQTNPQFYLNRTNVAASDYQEDAYIGTLVASQNVTTRVSNLSAADGSITVTPNPITHHDLRFTTKVQETLPSTITIYHSSGQQIMQTSVTVAAGTQVYAVRLPQTLSKGMYYAVIANRKWKAQRMFLLL